MSAGELWRVGHRSDPLAFTPLDLYEWNHRFDDARRRFRTLYRAEDPKTPLREVLTEFRPDAGAIWGFLDGLEHLDLHEITSRRRIVTQSIAGDLFDRLGAAAVRYPSRLDGNPALAVFEGRGELVAIGEPIALTDPAPAPLVAVCAEWELSLES